MRAALGAVATVVSPALGRTLLDLAAGHGLQAEGIDAAGRRVPASVLLDMTLEELGLAGLALRVFDPVEGEQLIPKVRKNDIEPTLNLLLRTRYESDLLRLQDLAIFYRAAYSVLFSHDFLTSMNFALAREGTRVYLSKSQSKRFHGCLDLPSDVELLNFGVVFNQHFEGELAIKIRHFETFPLANQRGRNQDSEVKILEHLRLALLQEMIDGTLEPGHSREVTLWSERTPCPSCQFALAQFVQFFDDLGVSIQFKVDWDRTNHPEQVEWHDPPDQGNFKAAVNPALHEFFWRGDPEGAPHPVIYSDEWWTTRVS